jgi:SMC interacting uncharacterized protein involved in chromosome segregation
MKEVQPSDAQCNAQLESMIQRAKEIRQKFTDLDEKTRALELLWEKTKCTLCR